MEFQIAHKDSNLYLTKVACNLSNQWREQKRKGTVVIRLSNLMDYESM